VDGCAQGLHNDAANGRFGYVYSLTSDTRRTVGGETQVFHDEDSARANFLRPSAGTNFYQSIEPRFNRLVIFDDRLPHAVSRVEGPMDPLEGRFVLHGHIYEAGPVTGGALSPEKLFVPAIDAARAYFHSGRWALDAYHGVVSIRLDVNASGRVFGCRTLMDRVVHLDRANMNWPTILAGLLQDLNQLSFKASAGDSWIIVPFVFGGELPNITRAR